MARMLNWNTAAFEAECIHMTMDRLEVCANVIRDDAKRILGGKLKGGWKEHGPYQRRYKSSKHKGGLVDYFGGGGGSSWTERRHGAMIGTIRVARSKDPTVRNIWVMAGNFNVWWAQQLEFGHGAWRGKAKPFLRPAFQGAPSRCRGILEGGAIGSVEI